MEEEERCVKCGAIIGVPTILCGYQCSRPGPTLYTDRGVVDGGRLLRVAESGVEWMCGRVSNISGPRDNAAALQPLVID